MGRRKLLIKKQGEKPNPTTNQLDNAAAMGSLDDTIKAAKKLTRKQKIAKFMKK